MITIQLTNDFINWAMANFDWDADEAEENLRDIIGNLEATGGIVAKPDPGQVGEVVKEVMGLVLSTLEAAGVPMARRLVIQAVTERYGLAPEYLESLAALPVPSVTFDAWLNRVADQFPAGYVMAASVEELRGWFDAGRTVERAAEEIRYRRVLGGAI